MIYRLSEFVMEDLLQGKKTCIRNGQLHFDSISFTKNKIYISYKDKKLVEWNNITTNYNPSDIYTLYGIKGKIKMTIL